jgi:hypothetical protein
LSGVRSTLPWRDETTPTALLPVTARRATGDVNPTRRLHVENAHSHASTPMHPDTEHWQCTSEPLLAPALQAARLFTEVPMWHACAACRARRQAVSHVPSRAASRRGAFLTAVRRRGWLLDGVVAARESSSSASPAHGDRVGGTGDGSEASSAPPRLRARRLSSAWRLASWRSERLRPPRRPPKARRRRRSAFAFRARCPGAEAPRQGHRPDQAGARPTRRPWAKWSAATP